MQRVAAIVREGQLVWREQGAARTLAVGSVGWFDWLAEARCFGFVGAGGSFTAHRERYQRGGWYWRAYRRQGGRLRRVYLGKPAALTLARLEEAARALAQQGRPETDPPPPAPAGPPRRRGSHPVTQGERPLGGRFAPPPPHKGLIERPALLGLLNAALRPLTLLAAPAGYGKTALLAEWCRAAGAQRALVWLTLDADDDHPQRFWAALLGALRARYPSLPAPDGPPTDALLRALAGIPHRVTLILDDYHLLRDPAIHAGVARLIDRLPPQARLVLSGRAEPPLPLARLRLRGLLAELHAAELRFSADEIARFCTSLGLDLGPRDLAALAERSEGWPGGLRLLAERLRDRQRAGAAPVPLLEQHPHLDALFAEEVLGPLPAPLHQFLCEVAVLDRLSGPLCDAVTGHSDSAILLERLHSASLFLSPADGAPSSYRLHPLFADFLRRRLDRDRPGAQRKLHRAACDWHVRHDAPREAIAHAVAGLDYDSAARLMSTSAPRLFAEGQIAPLLEWLAALPDALVGGQLRLSLIHVWALLLSGRWDGLEARLRTVAQLWLQPGAAGRPTPELLALRAVLDLGRGDTAAAAKAVEQAALLLPPDDALLPGMLAMLGSAAARASGDDRLAQRLLADARLLGMAGHANALALLALSHQAQLLAAQGRLAAARAAYQRVLDLAEPQPAHAAARGMASVGLAALAYERDELEAAASFARQGIADGEHAGTPELLVSGHSILAQIAQAQGEPDRARAMLDAGEGALWGRPVAPHTVLALHVGRAGLALAQGDSAAAAAWMHGYERQTSAHLPSQTDRARLMMARVLLAQGRADQAAALLECVRADAERSGRRGILPPLLVCTALAHRGRGLAEQAQTCLEQALASAAPEGYLRSFLEAGPTLVPLLAEAEARGVTPAYARQLLSAYAGQRPDGARHAHSRLLTERERAVLRLLSAGAANQQIANDLCISLSTVKKHLGAIFAKLSVATRTQAAARARLLELD
ncbi:MAG TPA: LuxR C-terminal-related transcriptional regulator [Roseiflexaceae bacterium]|nr:LuxR C-terminal-related transcriptional regulator [Roseiflexaceae bacterium]